MTRAATFKPNRSMLERKRAALVPMAVETSGLVGAEGLHHRGTDAAMWIVAVDAGHGTFRHLVVIGLLELRPYIQVATRALLINGGSLADYQVVASIRMNLMTGCAGHLVLHMTALEAAHVRGLIQVTSEANLVCGGRGELTWIADILDRKRLCVFLRRTVARLT